MLGIAISIASHAFERKKDRGGNPYMLHCIRVMMQMNTEEEKICAILHDFVEDHDEGPEFAKDFLKSAGFSNEVLLILELLTHRKGTDYMDYIRALAVHPVAKKIKLADLRDNSDITRLKGLREKDIARLHKYMIAYEYLKS